MTGSSVATAKKRDIARQFSIIAACALVLTFTCCGGAVVLNKHAPALASVLTIAGLVCFAALGCSSVVAILAGIVKFFANKKGPS